MRLKNNQYKWKKISSWKRKDSLLYHLVDRINKKTVGALYVRNNMFDAYFYHRDLEFARIYYRRLPFVKKKEYEFIWSSIPVITFDPRRLTEAVRMIEELHGIVPMDGCWGTKKRDFRIWQKKLIEKGI